MNRVYRRIVANKDFSKYKTQANNAFIVFKNDTKNLSAQFAQLLDTFEENNPATTMSLLNEMISKMDIMSTSLTTLKNTISKELGTI